MIRRWICVRIFHGFRAVCPVSKYLTQRAFGRATANNVERFLIRSLNRCLFRCEALQIDGGSESMAGFGGRQQTSASGQHCQDLGGIELEVLPPCRPQSRCPQSKGCVERVNRTVREEFYSQYQGEVDLASVIKGCEYQHQYNHFRPHRASALNTPMEYLERLGMAV